MSQLVARIEGIGYWSKGLPSWRAAVAFAQDGALPENAPARPSPQLLAPNERRRAPESVAVALDVALAACESAGRDPAVLPSVFASTHGDLGITDYMSEALAGADPASISPTRFHNSVHNAAAGYWTIGAGCMYPATALSAFDATFAQGLLEAMVQLATGSEAVLLVAYDTGAAGPLEAISDTVGTLGGALLLARDGQAGRRIEVYLEDGAPSPAEGPLAMREAGNAMRPMLPVFDALACENAATLRLDAGAGRVLVLDIGPA
ncbi:MAG: beta-ketoacyl synthase chain length factor [Xanthomonadaceae bacterium]|nr:beta-ketoacyl synthase chain length factor [Xanthomonadaceae bacterium]